jgi:hypothetical protein
LGGRPFSIFFQFIISSSRDDEPSHVPISGLGGNSFSKKLAIKIERRLLALKLDMEMWRIMTAKIHANNDSEKRGNDRRRLFYEVK